MKNIWVQICTKFHTDVCALCICTHTDVCDIIKKNERGDIVSASEAQRKATNKYIQEKVDEIKLRVPKGERETIRAHAETRGESLNGFIQRAVRETMERDKE